MAGLAMRQDNRFHAFGRAGAGFIVGIAFAGIDGFGVVGQSTGWSCRQMTS